MPIPIPLSTPLPVAIHSQACKQSHQSPSHHPILPSPIPSTPLPSPPPSPPLPTSPISSHPPVALLVVGQQFVDDALYPYEPARYSAVDERGLRAPAEGVAVLDLALVNKTALLLQMFHDGLICILGREEGEGRGGTGRRGRHGWEEGCVHIRVYVRTSANSQFNLHNTTHNTAQHTTHHNTQHLHIAASTRCY